MSGRPTADIMADPAGDVISPCGEAVTVTSDPHLSAGFYDPARYDDPPKLERSRCCPQCQRSDGTHETFCLLNIRKTA